MFVVVCVCVFFLPAKHIETSVTIDGTLGLF